MTFISLTGRAADEFIRKKKAWDAKLEVVREFLRETLRDDPRPVKEVDALAREAGIEWRHLKRVRERGNGEFEFLPPLVPGGPRRLGLKPAKL